MPDVHATIDFLKDLPLYQHEKPFVAVRDVTSQDTHDNVGLTNIEWDEREVVVRDVRGRFEDYSLDRTGFEILDLVDPTIPSFRTLDDVQQYQKMTESLLKKRLDADHVICFDCKLRKNVPAAYRLVDLNDPLTMEIPPRGVHDNSFDHIPILLGEALSVSEKRKYFVPGARLMVVNTWRPLLDRVEDRPLVLCDPRTVHKNDLVPMDRIFPHKTTESYYLRYSPQQKFVWLSNQRSNEMLLMKQFDTDPGANVRYCPHASFNDRSARNDAPLRESVETRSLVIYLTDSKT